jgi:hypothetical protein
MPRIASILRGDAKTVLTWSWTSASVVKVTSLTTAVYLRAAFSYRPTDIDGDALLEDYEIWVDDEDRPECERMLRENCPASSPAVWVDVIEVAFATEDEHRAFAAAYSAVTGMPNAFTPPTTLLAPDPWGANA